MTLSRRGKTANQLASEFLNSLSTNFSYVDSAIGGDYYSVGQIKVPGFRALASPFFYNGSFQRHSNHFIGATIRYVERVIRIDVEAERGKPAKLAILKERLNHYLEASH